MKISVSPESILVKPATYRAAMRCLRVLLDESGLTPEVVAQRAGWTVEEATVRMDKPTLLDDYFTLWHLCVEEHGGLMTKVAATLYTLMERNEVDEEMLLFFANVGYLYLVYKADRPKPPTPADE